MELFEQIAALRREGRPFALATVVSRRAPVSAHLGDRAIVFADGRMQGFVGGACSREIVRRQALDALKTRAPRLVSIRPEAGAADADGAHVTVPMTCASEGAIDVYVEPFVHARRLVIVGATPVAEAAARIARSMDYEVVRGVDAREQRDLEADAASSGVSIVPLDALDAVLADAADRGIEQAAIVASQGHYDEEALELLLRRAVPYVGLVASRKRAATICSDLEDKGVPGVGSIRNPAGLDLGAKTPPEVALSILAEIVQVLPAAARAADERRARGADASTPPPREAIDPVCGMTVEIDAARHRADVDGVWYYFCCAHCRAQFVENPQRFLAAR